MFYSRSITPAYAPVGCSAVKTAQPHTMLLYIDYIITN